MCLPTPLAPILAYVAGESQAVLEPVYERQLLAELDAILGVVPHDVLAVQWDTALEFAVLEGLLRAPFDDVEPSIIERLVRLGDHVPDDVELGYHLCYGDAGHKHVKEPDDTSKLVAVANALGAGLRRRLDWVHLPVPIRRTDDTYYAPLSSLRLAATTELYLGLIGPVTSTPARRSWRRWGRSRPGPPSCPRRSARWRWRWRRSAGRWPCRGRARRCWSRKMQLLRSQVARSQLILEQMGARSGELRGEGLELGGSGCGTCAEAALGELDRPGQRRLRLVEGGLGDTRVQPGRARFRPPSSGSSGTRSALPRGPCSSGS